MFEKANRRLYAEKALVDYQQLATFGFGQKTSCNIRTAVRILIVRPFRNAMRIIAILILFLAFKCPAESNAEPSPVVIESVVIDGRPATLSGRLPSVKVRTAKERVEIHYTDSSIATTNEGHFRYQLVGSGADWTDAGNTRAARFSQLLPGRYRFVVQSANKNGAWNENGATLLITVGSSELWFKLLLVVGVVALLFAGLLYFLIHRRKEVKNSAT